MNPPGRWSRLQVRCRQIWGRLQSRPDTEHEQALIRLAVGVILFFYLLPGAFIHAGQERQADLAYLGAMLAFLAAAAALIVRIFTNPGVSRARRIFGAAIDSAATAFFMIAADIYALPLFLVYIWITLANGFRYGPGYLLTSLGLSVVSFAVVMVLSPFWRANAGVGLGLITGLVVLSVYVLTLVRRMSAAVARAEAANQAKRRFISVVSHEMRTPLNAIVNMTDLLRDTPLNREQVDMAQTLAGSSRVLLGLVEDVLDFSKIEAGKLTLEKTDFDLHALVNSTAKILEQQAHDKGLELVVSMMPEVAPALRGDPHHLRQVLINLIGNAIKFTQKGSITVHVSLIEEMERSAGSEQCVRLKFSVRDTGIGIPPDAQRRIFDSFAQADESTSRRFGGTGLGTTIAKQLVELMGGRMGLESAVGLGSTFWFEVGLEKQSASVTRGEGELGDGRVLVVGFPRAEQGALLAMLKDWGALPVIADRPEQAAQQILREISIAPAPGSALIYSGSPAEGQAALGLLRSAAQLPGLPAVIVLPREVRPEGLQSVAGGRNLVLSAPLDKRLLFNALHAVTAAEQDRRDVVFLSDYLKRRENAPSFRVLVADDNASNRTVISKILERAGHAVVLVESGEQVLDAMERGQYDLVILDRNMPDMGGIEALKNLRFLQGGTQRVPVIVLSADVTTEARQESLDAGADAFLSKPIEAPKLLDVIAELAGGVESVARAEPRAEPRAVPAPPRRAQVAAADAPAILNHETLRLLEELGSGSGQHGEFMERLIGAFIKDTEQILRRLDQDATFLPGGDFRSLVHALKGSVSSVGADRLTQYCNRVAGMSDAALRADSRGVARALREEFDAVRKSLSDYLARARRTTG
jgi:two-component system sensor histidine kinase RpfC